MGSVQVWGVRCWRVWGVSKGQGVDQVAGEGYCGRLPRATFSALPAAHTCTHLHASALTTHTAMSYNRSL